ncbi:hypothetical protein DB30_01517 [Enhygromyxa salina]|uniref:Uncharacterized protein n=1 Tax=Enhygromyxa salina TaxID=215803 RepID=A0A0C2CRX1_9BACT|nr:hypothetical protein [Enhygromyxa salina]KIG12395.1 hypothetical protein DB30_01517 [Enhygromyxa salina]
MTKYLLPLCAALLFLPTVALAAPATTNDEGATVKNVGPDREIIFGIDDEIEGEVLKPGGVDVGGSVAKKHASMIGIRGEFIDKMIFLSFDI